MAKKVEETKEEEVEKPVEEEVEKPVEKEVKTEEAVQAPAQDWKKKQAEDEKARWEAKLKDESWQREKESSRDEMAGEWTDQLSDFDGSKIKF